MTSYSADKFQNKQLTAPTVLVVEDDEAIGEFIVAALTQAASYHAIHVTNAAQAVEVATFSNPCLFLLDYRLPGITGLELADRLHSMKGLETIPTLMISANLPPRQALQQRHIHFLAKPFELNDLLRTVEHLLAEYRDKSTVPFNRGRFTGAFADIRRNE